MSFWGFDDKAHTGELIVHRDAADAMVQVFGQLFAERFPIEDMRVSSMADLDAPNTGDGNTTAAFVCRPTRGSSRWSEHAYGLAVDVNPFQNPYVRDGGVIPGLAGSYLDRANVRPGMLEPGTGPVAAFAAIGWRWGGEWRTRATTCTSAPTAGERGSGQDHARACTVAGAPSTRRTTMRSAVR